MAKKRKVEKRNRGNDTCGTRPGITHKTPQDQDRETAWGPTCRLCGEREETIMHVLSECKKTAQTEYKKRHDKVRHLDLLEALPDLQSTSFQQLVWTSGRNSHRNPSGENSLGLQHPN